MSKNSQSEDEASDRRSLPGALSILQLSQLTGKSRENVTSKLTDLPFTEGTKGAKLYDSKAALAAIYDRVNRPQDALALAKIEEIKLNMEVKRGERIPIEEAEMIFDQALRVVPGVLLGHIGKTLTDELVNEILEAMREAWAKSRNG